MVVFARAGVTDRDRRDRQEAAVFMTSEGTDWLADAVFYEIYPQSFADSNGDGIGDLRGALAHLDHLQWLGVNTIWFNPCFASPFIDAGYDVSDYLKIAPRYGTNDDMVEFVAAARERGIRVILDLVAGHTSIEHPWFQAELQADGPSPEGDRYVWSDRMVEQANSPGAPGETPWVPSPGPRPGYYLKNFYDEQPALNFGYGVLRADEPWRVSVDAPGPQRNQQALREIMAFWLDRGVSGFRVDMAFSLVKDDEGYAQTTALWRGLRRWLDEIYPSAVIIPEGGEPRTDEPAAFDADFLLVIDPAHGVLFDNGGAGRLYGRAPVPPAFFDADGQGSTERFLQFWNNARSTDPGRLILLASADHDFSRLAGGGRTTEQLGAAFTFLLTWGSVPSIYYGDEIGMRYQEDLPNVEGSVIFPGYYNRSGVRTPMQWNDTKNAGFSTATPDALYLPIDPSPDRPTVAAQLNDPDSTLSLVKALIALRRATPALGGRSPITVLNASYPFVYMRGDTHLVVINPRRDEAGFDLSNALSAKALLSHGVTIDGSRIFADGFGYGVFGLN
ncbi:MAG: putative alpha amylase [Pseudonocardiales bacterium]|nr:putative alpha amylase [Pseudonocardiales bacterium]